MRGRKRKLPENFQPDPWISSENSDDDGLGNRGTPQLHVAGVSGREGPPPEPQTSDSEINYEDIDFIFEINVDNDENEGEEMEDQEIGNDLDNDEPNEENYVHYNLGDGDGEHGNLRKKYFVLFLKSSAIWIF